MSCYYVVNYPKEESEVRILKNLSFFDLRVRISILWLFSWGAFLGLMLLSLLKPGVLNAIISGEAEVQGLGMKIGPETLFMYAVLVLLPLVMAFLTVTLKDSITRWANIIMGTIGVILSAIAIYGEFTNPYAATALIWISKIVVDVLIVWYAYKWPK